MEAITATFITMYIFLAAWAIYVMGAAWWHEISPRIETQRIARIALSTIKEGIMDSTAGTYVVGAATFSRRNGIVQATAVPEIPSLGRINYALEPDSSNARSFYLGNDDAGSGLKVLYYQDNAGTAHKIESTLGLTGLKFENYPDSVNLIKVTATAQKNVVGARQGSHTIKSEYSDTVYLKNVAG